MDKTNLPPGPYTVGTGQRDARGIYDADHNLLVAATVHTRHFLPYLCTAANAHAALRDACTDMVKWLENPDPATFTKEHILTIIAATKAALALAEEVE